jgi:hypothetical protein
MNAKINPKARLATDIDEYLQSAKSREDFLRRLDRRGIDVSFENTNVEFTVRAGIYGLNEDTMFSDFQLKGYGDFSKKAMIATDIAKCLQSAESKEDFLRRLDRCDIDANFEKASMIYTVRAGTYGLNEKREYRDNQLKQYGDFSKKAVIAIDIANCLQSAKSKTDYQRRLRGCGIKVSFECTNVVFIVKSGAYGLNEEQKYNDYQLEEYGDFSEEAFVDRFDTFFNRVKYKLGHIWRALKRTENAIEDSIDVVTSPQKALSVFLALVMLATFSTAFAPAQPAIAADTSSPFSYSVATPRDVDGNYAFQPFTSTGSPDYEIFGFVTDDRGVPLNDATVRFYDDHPSNSSGDPFFTVRSGEGAGSPKGFFGVAITITEGSVTALDGFNFWIEITKDGFDTVNIPQASYTSGTFLPDNPRVIYVGPHKLEPSVRYTYQGRVTASDTGNSLAGATVALYYSDTGVFIGETTTNADATVNFTISGMAAVQGIHGFVYDYNVEISRDGYETTHIENILMRSSTSINNAAGTITDVNAFMLQANPRITSVELFYLDDHYYVGETVTLRAETNTNRDYSSPFQSYFDVFTGNPLSDEYFRVTVDSVMVDAEIYLAFGSDIIAEFILPLNKTNSILTHTVKLEFKSRGRVFYDDFGKALTVFQHPPNWTDTFTIKDDGLTRPGIVYTSDTYALVFAEFSSQQGLVTYDGPPTWATSDETRATITPIDGKINGRYAALVTPIDLGTVTITATPYDFAYSAIGYPNRNPVMGSIDLIVAESNDVEIIIPPSSRHIYITQGGSEGAVFSFSNPGHINLMDGKGDDFKPYTIEVYDETKPDRPLVYSERIRELRAVIPASALTSVSVYDGQKYTEAYSVKISYLDEITGDSSEGTGYIIVVPRPLYIEVVPLEKNTFDVRQGNADVSWECTDGYTPTVTVTRINGDVRSTFNVVPSNNSARIEFGTFGTRDADQLKTTFKIDLVLRRNDEAVSQTVYIEVYNDRVIVLDKPFVELSSMKKIVEAQQSGDFNGSIQRMRRDLELAETIRLRTMGGVRPNANDLIRATIVGNTRIDGDVSIITAGLGVYNAQNATWIPVNPSDMYGFGTSFTAAGYNDTDGSEVEITIEHVKSAIQAHARVSVETLKHRLYIGAVFPVGGKETTVYYYKNDNRIEFSTDAMGRFSLFEEDGLAGFDGHIFFERRETINGIERIWVGQVSPEDLMTGEGDAFLYQLYPSNIIELREMSTLKLAIKASDKTPFRDPVLVSGTMIIGDTDIDDTMIVEQQVEPDSDGIISIFIEPNLFVDEMRRNPGVPISYEYVIDPMDDKHAPILKRVTGSASSSSTVSFGHNNIVELQVWDRKNLGVPYVLSSDLERFAPSGRSAGIQSGMFTRTGGFGINDSFPTGRLHFDMVIDGNIDNMDLINGSGFTMPGQFSRETRPFLSDKYSYVRLSVPLNNSVVTPYRRTNTTLRIYRDNRTFAFPLPFYLTNAIGLGQRAEANKNFSIPVDARFNMNALNPQILALGNGRAAGHTRISYPNDLRFQMFLVPGVSDYEFDIRGYYLPSYNSPPTLGQFNSIKDQVNRNRVTEFSRIEFEIDPVSITPMVSYQATAGFIEGKMVYDDIKGHFNITFTGGKFVGSLSTGANVTVSIPVAGVPIASINVGVESMSGTRTSMNVSRDIVEFTFTSDAYVRVFGGFGVNAIVAQMGVNSYGRVDVAYNAYTQVSIPPQFPATASQATQTVRRGSNHSFRGTRGISFWYSVGIKILFVRITFWSDEIDIIKFSVGGSTPRSYGTPYTAPRLAPMNFSMASFSTDFNQYQTPVQSVSSTGLSVVAYEKPRGDWGLVNPGNADELEAMFDGMDVSDIIGLINDVGIAVSVNGGPELFISDGSHLPNFSPIVSTDGERAVVIWSQLMYTNANASGSFDDLLDFTTSLMFSKYENGVWSEAARLDGNVNGLISNTEVTMGNDGVAVITDVHSNTTANNNIVAYHVDNSGNIQKILLNNFQNAVCTNPQLAAVSDGFLLSWHESREGQPSDIVVKKLLTDGSLDTSFGLSIAEAARKRGLRVSEDYLLLSDPISDDIAIAWISRELREDDDIIEIYAVKLLEIDTHTEDGIVKQTVASYPMKLMESVGADQIIRLTSGSLNNNAITVNYSSTEVSYRETGNVNQPIEYIEGAERQLTASGLFKNDFISSKHFDINDIRPNSEFPIFVNLQGIGIEPIRQINITMAGIQSTHNVNIQPGDNIGLYLFHQMGDIVEDIPYTIEVVYASESKSIDGVLRTKISDVSIAGAEVIEAGERQRMIAVDLKGLSFVPLGEVASYVEVEFYDCPSMSRKLTVRNINGGTDTTIRGSDLALIDEGMFRGYYVFEIPDDMLDDNSEIPSSGLPITIKVSIKDSNGTVLEEIDYAHNDAMVILYSLTQQYGSSVNMFVDEERTANATTANVTLLNPSFQEIGAGKGQLTAILLNEQNQILDSQVISITSSIGGESTYSLPIEFDQEGDRILTMFSVIDVNGGSVSDSTLKSLSLEAIPFDLNETDIAIGASSIDIELSNEYGVHRTLITAIANDPNATISIDGVEYHGHGIAVHEFFISELVETLEITVSTDNSATTYNVEIHSTDTSNNLCDTLGHDFGTSRNNGTHECRRDDCAAIEICSPNIPSAACSTCGYVTPASGSTGNGGGAGGGSDPAPTPSPSPSPDSSPEPNPTHESWINIFADLDPNHPYYEAIAFMNIRGLIVGYGNGNVGPDDTLTRAQFATLLWNLEGQPSPEGTVNFSDVQEDAWYYAPVQWAAEQGVVAGVGGGLFAPDTPISRQEVVQMLYNYAVNFKGYKIPKNRDISDYTDKGKIDVWAESAAKALAEAGVLRDEKEFRPTDDATRGEAADMFMNFLRFIAGK